jgi:hypothetical protein
MELNLTGDQWNSIVHALQVAAERYLEDKRVVADQPRLVEQFERQAQEAQVLAEHISKQTGV